MAPSRKYAFGEFLLDAEQRALFRRGSLVGLAPKSLETLLFLVERHGRIVDKKDLLSAVWPDTFVAEVSLARNISILRKILSEGEEGRSFIETIPKRGYRFVAPVTGGQDELAGLSSATPVALPSDGADQSQTTRASGLTSSSRRGWLVAVAACVLAGAGFAYRLTASRPVLSFVHRDWVMIADTENRTGDPRFDKALLTALTVSIEQSRYANVVPRSRIYEALKRMGRPQDPSTDVVVSEALGLELCARENVRALLLTSLTRTGKEYLLILRLVDPKDGTTVRSYRKKVDQEDALLDAVDAVAADVRRDLGETLYSIRQDDRPLAAVTTSSLSALQHYSQAVELWRTAKYPESRSHLEEALRIDPDFAMAHASMANELYSHIFSEPKAGKQEYEKALALSNRVTDRERMFIQAGYAGTQDNPRETEHLYRALLTFYPDDSAAHFNLASLLMRIGRWDDGIAEFRQLIRVNPADVSSHIMIATCYANQAKYSEALPYYDRAFELEPARLHTGNLTHEYGFTLIGAGKPDKAREIFGSLLEIPEGRGQALRSLGLLDVYQGRFKEAAQRFREAIEVNESRHEDLAALRNRLYLATILGGEGDRAGELRTLDQASQSNQMQRVDWLAYRIGVAYARAGAADRASGILAIAKKGGSVDAQESLSDTDRLEGEVELVRGNCARAVQLLEKAHSETHPPLSILTLESLARAYSKAGELDKAVSSYESLIDMQGGNALGWETQLPWLEAHYELAKIHFSRGNADRANELLATLLKIWANADPDVPLLKQVKRLRDSTTSTQH